MGELVPVAERVARSLAARNESASPKHVEDLLAIIADLRAKLEHEHAQYRIAVDNATTEMLKTREAEARVRRLEEALRLYEQYVAFLNEAYETPIRLAAIHGWKCPQGDIERGQEFRNEIGVRVNPPSQEER